MCHPTSQHVSKTLTLRNHFHRADHKVTVTYEAHWPKKGQPEAHFLLVAAHGVVFGRKVRLDDTEDWRASWINAVTATLTERIALKLSYAMLYDDQPVVVLVPPDPGAPGGTLEAPYVFDELDTILTASVVINF